MFSNSVMEHVPRDAIRTGISIHSVNCGDHYAYFDRSITAINYLRFSDRQSRYTPKAKLLAVLPLLRVAGQFSRYPPDELCSTSIDFAVRRKATPSLDRA
jgi:hypothetical protein